LLLIIATEFQVATNTQRILMHKIKKPQNQIALKNKVEFSIAITPKTNDVTSDE